MRQPFGIQRRLVVQGAGSHIDFTADNGAQPRLGGLGVKLQGTEHGAVVGDGHGLHPVSLGLLEQRIDADRAVEQAVLGVDMQMNKRAFGSFRHADGLS